MTGFMYTSWFLPFPLQRLCNRLEINFLIIVYFTFALQPTTRMTQWFLHEAKKLQSADGLGFSSRFDGPIKVYQPPPRRDKIVSCAQVGHLASNFMDNLVSEFVLFLNRS